MRRYLPSHLRKPKKEIEEQYFADGGAAENDSGGLLGMLGGSSTFQTGNIYGRDQLQQETNQQGQIYNGQQGLAQQLQSQMMGQGPNPAQLQYLQNVGSNNANAAGLIAGQRGVNPALAARMGANAGSAANMQAANQAAQLQQQQQLAATSNLGNLYGQMQQGNLGYQNLYGQQALGASRLNQNTSISNAQGNQSLIGGIFGGIGSALGIAHGGEVPHQGYAGGGGVAPAPVSVGEEAFQPMLVSAPKFQSKPIFGIKNKGIKAGPQSSLGSTLSAPGADDYTGVNPMTMGLIKLGEGIGGGRSPAGAAPAYSRPGQPVPDKTLPYNYQASGEYVPQGALSTTGAPAPELKEATGGKGLIGMLVNYFENKKNQEQFGRDTANYNRDLEGPKTEQQTKEEESVPGPGRYGPENQSMQDAPAPMEESQYARVAPNQGGDNSGMADLDPGPMEAHGGKIRSYKPGGKVPGKAKYAGDNYGNDTVDAKLSPGEIVIPRSVLNSRDPVKDSARFVAAIMARKRMGK